MKKIMRLLASTKIVYRKSTALTKIVVITAIVLSITAIIMLRVTTDKTRERAENLRQQAIALEQEERHLQEYEDEKGTVEEIRRIAREQLGLEDPDSTIISANPQ